jgi:hypothetical protein
MPTEPKFRASSLRPLTIDSIDVENDQEFDALTRQVLDAGNLIARREREEMIRKGILDARGNLLKTELPDDMKHEDRDFGGSFSRPRMVVVAGPPGSGKTTRFPTGSAWRPSHNHKSLR